MLPRDSLRPAEVPENEVAACLGLISDTHYPERAKLDRRAAFGHRAGTGIVVYGHTHIPSDVTHQGIRLVNPGALAPGNFKLRQSCRTVALLYLLKSGAAEVVHVDLAQPDRPFAFTIDWAAGFRTAMLRFQQPLSDGVL